MFVVKCYTIIARNEFMFGTRNKKNIFPHMYFISFFKDIFIFLIKFFKTIPRIDECLPNIFDENNNPDNSMPRESMYVPSKAWRVYYTKWKMLNVH